MNALNFALVQLAEAIKYTDSITAEQVRITAIKRVPDITLNNLRVLPQ